MFSPLETSSFVFGNQLKILKIPIWDVQNHVSLFCLQKSDLDFTFVYDSLLCSHAIKNQVYKPDFIYLQ